MTIEEMMEDAAKEARAEAIAEKEREIAEKMKFNGMTTEEISKYTGLSKEEIEKL